MKSNFKVGQTVYCVLFGEGEVIEITDNTSAYPIHVQFSDDGTREYTNEGKYYDYACVNRTLFFTKPEVQGATEPVFEPQLKEGDKVAAVWGDNGNCSAVFTVYKEIDDRVYHIDSEGYNQSYYPKRNVQFFKLGEEIKF